MPKKESCKEKIERTRRVFKFSIKSMTYKGLWHRSRFISASMAFHFGINGVSIGFKVNYRKRLDKAQQICFKKKSNKFLFERKSMPKFKKSASIPTQHASDFIDHEQTNGQTVSLYVSDPAEYRVKPKEPFVLLFYRSLLSVIVDKKLTTTDLKVILTVLDFVSQGNVVSLTHQDVANKAKLVRQQVTNSLRKLVGAEILLKSEGGSLLLNPNLIAKENLKEMKATEAYQLAARKTPKLAF